MKGSIFTRTSALALVALLASSLSLAAQQRQHRYSIVNLGTTGGSASAAISITNPNWISGFSVLADNQTTNAVLWRHGAAMNLGTLGGPNSGMGWPNHRQN